MGHMGSVDFTEFFVKNHTEMCHLRLFVGLCFKYV